MDYPQDRKFKIKRFVTSYPVEAARRAVLFRFTTAQGGLREAERRLRTWWRGRLQDIAGSAAIGWLTGGSDVQFARNCPPVGVVTDDQTRRCRGRAYFCPYCRGRQVASVYARMADFVFPERLVRRSTCDVVGIFRYDRRVPFRYDPRDTPIEDFLAEQADVWSDALDEAARHVDAADFRRFAESPFCKAAFVYAQPYLDLCDVVVTVGAVFAGVGGEAALGEAAASVDHYRATCDFHAGFDREDLMRLVALPFEFPFDMHDQMQDGVLSNHQLPGLLSVTAGRRLLRTYGGCYA